MANNCNVDIIVSSNCPIAGLVAIDIEIRAWGTIAGNIGGSTAGTVLGTATATSEGAPILVTNTTAVDVASAFSGTMVQMVVDKDLLPEDVEICAIVSDNCGTSNETCQTAAKDPIDPMTVTGGCDE